ncbi:amino acid adenylation domain-containing protein [Jatrophihabitans sp.]|jgi:amino acid adenylation domain-containing protein|uniref:amino acid adenylation domain-containing protein n=1 Tax=Jatrophihabitans sp. TaxID=1932789 RepID=UPI002EDDAACA
MTTPTVSLGVTIGEAFARIVATTPTAIAVRCGDRSLSYAELDARANQLAHHLLRRGVRREVPVAVVNDHSEAVVISLLAIVKAGGSYLGIDSRQPAERITAMLAMAGADLVLTDGSQAPGTPGHAEWLQVSSLDLSAEPTTDPEVAGDPAQLAYLAYTSGSTGVPKAAMIPHAAVIRLVSGADYLTVRPEDVFLQLAPLAFDATTLEVWAPLLNGASLIVPTESPDGIAAIGDLVRQHHVTVLWLTAGLFHQFCNAGLPGLDGLRCLLSGGDVLSVPSVNRALAELPGVALINGYGPTENTTFTCCYPITEQRSDPVPIGFPISGTTVHLLDEELRPVAEGQPGELCTGGHGLARGYLGRPGWTAERFVPDPFAEIPGGRLYRTGDLARRRADGALDFLGRLDDQVKIRGFRVELGEVEAALRGLPEVEDAAVIAQQSRFGRRLVGFAVLAEPASASPIALRRSLTTLLPDYALPSMVVLLDRLPLNKNGKVDRPRLESHTGRDRPAGLSSVHRPPRTETEHAVADTWELLMDVAGIGIDDDFFELGGHSLMAVAIASELSDAAGVRVLPWQLYKHSTVAELAHLLDGLRNDQAGLSAQPAGAGAARPAEGLRHASSIGPAS